jgi:hypothetical protein
MMSFIVYIIGYYNHLVKGLLIWINAGMLGLWLFRVFIGIAVEVW